MHIYFHRYLTTALLESTKGENGRRCYLKIPGLSPRNICRRSYTVVKKQEAVRMWNTKLRLYRLSSYIYHYENTPIQIYWKFYHQKNENFQIQNLIFFLFLLKNTDCVYSLEPPRRGGSNEYPQSMFWAEIRKIIYTPVNPTFTIWKWGLRGSALYRHVFVMAANELL